MGDFLLKLLSGINNPELTTLLVSAFPLVELKGAIPIGTGLFNLGLFETAGIAYLGSTIISILVFFLLIPIFNLLKKIGFIRKIIEKIESIFHKKAQEIASKTNGSAEKEAKKIMMISLFIFVAVPFPVTGVWTGTAIAVFLGLRFRDVILPAILGNLVAGLIISALAEICIAVWSIAVLDYILYALFALAIILLVIVIIKIAKQKTEKE
jgi:uncharacterized membrane protein